jgi:tetratricopeptide (TPR) repeat protein
MRKGEVSVATRYYQRAIEARPSNADFAMKLAHAYLLGDQPGKAVPLARLAVEAGQAGASLLLADALLGTGDVDGADRTLGKDWNAEASTPDGRVLAARVCLARGDLAGAVAAATEAAEASRQDRFVAYEASLLARARNVARAVDLARAASKDSYDDAQTIGDVGAAFLLAGATDDQKKLLPAFVQAFHGTAADVVARARRRESSGDHETAIRFLLWAAAWEPANGETLKALGEQFFRNGEDAWAIQFLEASLNEEPFRVTYDGKPLSAVRAGAIAPLVVRVDDVATIYHTLSAAFSRRGENGDAAQALEQAALLVGDRRSSTWVEIAEAWVKAGDSAAAMSTAMEILRADPENGPSNFIVASVLEVRGQLEVAIGHARRAWQADPGNLEVGLLLGRLFVEHEQLDAARVVFETTLEKHPGDARLRSAIATLPGYR